MGRTASIESFQSIRFFRLIYTEGDPETEEESRLAVAAAWGLRTARRGSNATVVKGNSDREKIALDINILKKQYDKLKERQKQAHIILTSGESESGSSTFRCTNVIFF